MTKKSHAKEMKDTQHCNENLRNLALKPVGKRLIS